MPIMVGQESMKFILLYLFFNIACVPPPAIFQNTGRGEFKRTFNKFISENGANTNFGIKVISLATGETLYSLNSTKLMTPASNMKLFTAAAAIHYLGPDHQFKTSVLIDKKNLVLKGGGDPNLTLEQLDSLAGIVSGKIKSVDTLFLDASLLDSIPYGEGWMWDEGAWEFAAPIGALSVNDNCVEIEFRPGKMGKPARIKSIPKTDYISIENLSITVNDTVDYKNFKVDRDWSKRTNKFTIFGELLRYTSVDTVKRNIQGPTQFTGSLFKESLESKRTNVGLIYVGTKSSLSDILAVHMSDSLYKSVMHMMHDSDNLTAELLVKTMGIKIDTPGNWKTGIDTMKTFLFDKVGIDTAALRIADGSGLSRYNLLSADHVIDLLVYMYHSCESENFVQSLPAGGTLESTMEKRLITTGGKIRAKSGTMSGISTLSGYAFSPRYGPVAFSILMNGFIGSPKPAQDFQDKICEWLVRD